MKLNDKIANLERRVKVLELLVDLVSNPPVIIQQSPYDVRYGPGEHMHYIDPYPTFNDLKFMSEIVLQEILNGDIEEWEANKEQEDITKDHNE